MPDPVAQDLPPLPPILALGFRPFFLAAGVWALLAVPLWLAVLWGWLPAQPYYQGTAWHAHSLLFGYGMAVIAGFLLTATRNWTGMATPTGASLAGLLALWLAGRVLPWLSVPGALSAAVDVAFPIVLALSLRRPLWSGPNPVNRVFLALLFGMALAALLVHLEVLGVLPGGALAGDRLMLDLIIGTLLLVAGRVLPFFTRSAVPGAAPVSRPWVEALTFGLWGLWTLGDATGWVPELTGGVALALAALQAIRLADWHHPRAWGIPILAVLYAGYLWLILGIGLNGLAHLGLLPPFPALHALTIGAIGVFTLGMMSRVTLGHTGRPMVAPPAMILAFWALNLAALTRVAGPLVWPAAYGGSLLVSGTLWGLAFGLFLWVHGPMLIGPRADGRPG
jgi:uncharacterized protein involved in response to NO